MFTFSCLFYFTTKSPSSAVKLCHMIGRMFNSIIHVPKFRSPSGKKLWAKNVPNSARFRTTSDFDREYLRFGWRYQKSERHAIDKDSSRVRRKKSRELWSTNNTVLGCGLCDPPKSTYLEDHMSALWGCCRLKFLHSLENGQGLLAHAPPGTGVPQQLFLTINIPKLA